MLHEHSDFMPGTLTPEPSSLDPVDGAGELPLAARPPDPDLLDARPLLIPQIFLVLVSTEQSVLGTSVWILWWLLFWLAVVAEILRVDVGPLDEAEEFSSFITDPAP
jgi:hypothetical protein